ncbi:hypothetical protein BX616_006217 [Lobosporangium transversale]|uniref:Chitin-binding type-4 domain-containing protein n=1 Tax=Lobosporangium transversale TaxID=64571 RepID=A0A1Y2GTE1_9FUNG|nr:hypothetical protein BCR41DRAFT_351109 [Lobosporangium transversale]KAF9915412.1 hypothetical protein BX616_006217 [Lobosporangium transversale]ORZ20000.1 hypothetical protein BCR41DRAFT_351109 [Lobosporangium transversale]|eukprot:XP_021882540.1 hypothetical protein BCR41DRAFT_351109 [Lobosporangium transversale]
MLLSVLMWYIISYSGILTIVSQAHVGLLRPCARGSPQAGCPAPSKGQRIDYDLSAPIGTSSSRDAPLCRQSTPSTTRTIVKAGHPLETTYLIGAAHGGGHCQWALSYDNGENWVVIKTIYRNCLKGLRTGQHYSISIPIPKSAPSGKATLMWLWNNALGVRELYSNCADIEIHGGPKTGKLSGIAPLIANYGSGSVKIGEFGADPRHDDRRAAFTKRKAITITV